MWASARPVEPPVSSTVSARNVATARPADELIGLVLGGRYRVLRRVTQGTVGIIYEAEHLRLGRRVAVKALARRLVDVPNLLGRFRQEAIAVGRLHHAHIVDVYDFDVAPTGQPYLVMELLDGETLRQALKHRGRFGVDEAFRLVAELCSALGAAHDAGVVHRDLKPDNVLVVPRADGRSSVKLIDFGVSRLLEAASSLTADHAILGTPEYMAPEQATGSSRSADGRADQFALGVIAYELVSGRSPFRAESPEKALRAVIERDPPSLARVAPEVPSALAAVIERALEKHPDDRFADMGAFAAALDDARMLLGERAA